jgi:hypothetical protein
MRCRKRLMRRERSKPPTSLPVDIDKLSAPDPRYGFLVGAGGGGIFMFEFILEGAAVFAGLAVLVGAVFAGLVAFALAFSLMVVLQPAARAPRANVATSAAIFNFVMKSPL